MFGSQIWLKFCIQLVRIVQKNSPGNSLGRVRGRGRNFSTIPPIVPIGPARCSLSDNARPRHAVDFHRDTISIIKLQGPSLIALFARTGIHSPPDSDTRAPAPARVFITVS